MKVQFAPILTIGKTLASLSNYLFIEHCRICKSMFDGTSSNAKTICANCFPKLLQEPIVSRFEIDEQHKLTVISATKYDSTMKSLIYKLKYYGDQLIASDLAHLMIPSIELALCNEDLQRPSETNSLLIPIPLSKWRTIQRGFNQSEILAKEVSRRINVRTECRFLKRKKHTAPQHNLSKCGRSANLTGAFVTPEDARFSRQPDLAILIDDICTSGATLLEATKTLNQCGWTNVIAVTASRAILEIESEAVRIAETRYLPNNSD